MCSAELITWPSVGMLNKRIGLNLLHLLIYPVGQLTTFAQNCVARIYMCIALDATLITRQLGRIRVNLSSGVHRRA